MTQPCSWCATPTDRELTIERRHSVFSTNTPVGKMRVRADRKVPCCVECLKRLTRQDAQFIVSGEGTQLDVFDVLEMIEKEKK